MLVCILTMFLQMLLITFGVPLGGFLVLLAYGLFLSSVNGGVWISITPALILEFKRAPLCSGSLSLFS